jgi:hypothetical protein
MTQTIDEAQASKIIDAYYSNIGRDGRTRITQAMRDAVNGVLSKTPPSADDEAKASIAGPNSHTA